MKAEEKIVIEKTLDNAATLIDSLSDYVLNKGIDNMLEKLSDDIDKAFDVLAKIEVQA